MKNGMLFAIAIITAALPLLAGADAIDEAEAKRRGVSVERVQLDAAKDRIATLELKLAEGDKQIAELNRQIAASKVSGVTVEKSVENKTADANSSTIVAQKSVQKDPRELPEYLQAYIKFRDVAYAGVLNNKRINLSRSHDQKLAAEIQKMVADGPRKFVFDLAADGNVIQVGQGGIISAKVRIVQVVNEAEALIEHHDSIYMVKGLDMKNMADDALIVIARPLIASRTVKYDTTFGAKTVILLEAFDPKLYEDYP